MKTTSRDDAQRNTLRVPSICMAAAVLVLSGAHSTHAAIKSWNTGNGNWTSAANWSPAGVPGSNDVVRIGNHAGAQNATVNAVNAPFIPDEIEITDGMTLDAGGTEFVGFDLLVSIDDGARMIVRPHAGINQYDFIGEMHIGESATLELTNNVPIQLFWDSMNAGTIKGWGEILVNSQTPFNNSGVINPGNNMLKIDQGWSGNFLPFDLDGSSEDGQVLLNVPYSILELNAGSLTDPFTGEINMVPGTLLTMNVEDGWFVDLGGMIDVDGGAAVGASQINGDDLTLAGYMLVGNAGHLRVLADATLEYGANNWVYSYCHQEWDGATIVNDGWIAAAIHGTIDFDGPTTVRGGHFQSASSDPAQGVVNLNGSTTWNGSGPVEITGITRQMGNAFVNGPMVINGDPGAVFDMDGDGDTQWTIWNDLTINADLAAAPDAYDTFTGTLNIASTAGKLTMNVQPAYWDFHMSGVMNLIGHPAVYHTRYAGDTLTLHGQLNASGKVASAGYIWAYEGAINVTDPGATLRLDGGCIIGLDCAINGDGEIRVNPGAPLKALFPNANFHGVGLRNEGRMGVPGQSFVDRFQQTEGGTWGVFLRGYDADDNDHLSVTDGDAALDGVLEVDLFMFSPVVGDEFTILTATGNVTGAFDSIVNNGCDAGQSYQWSVLYGQHTVTLRLDAINLLPGDMNCDCTVNGLDIQRFVNAVLDPVAYALDNPGCSVLHADVNADGIVNQADCNPFMQLLLGAP